MNKPIEEHVPVLADILYEQIKLPHDAAMVDATVGQGGHSYLFGKDFSEKGMVIGFDVDENSLKSAEDKLKGLACQVKLVKTNFRNIKKELARIGVDKVDFILADFGVCSAQLVDKEIGLSFQENMPLDMRMDRSLRTTAADLVNKLPEDELADLIFKYGEERASRRISRFIAEHRKSQKILTTAQLAMVVCRALGKNPRDPRTRIHPATRTFQALRIAVNDELGSIEGLLNDAPAVLKDGGYVAAISFHSLEDRIVKNNFKNNKKNGIYEVLTKKPIEAGDKEVRDNPRARSAKLRIARKIQAD